MSTSGEVLQVIIENANWSILLVAAEKALNDSIKDELGGRFPDYKIIQAFDWFEIGRKITEEKPGFILLDENLSGVDIPRFIQTLRDDPVFGKPYIFVLTNGLLSYNSDLLLTLPIDMNKLEAVLKDVEKQNDAAVNA
jgi:DNA-binding response OmpR family regulator